MALYSTDIIGWVGVCVPVTTGISPEKAVKAMSAARGNQIPETEEQRRCIDHYAAILAGTE